jgi:hypothetical protein
MVFDSLIVSSNVSLFPPEEVKHKNDEQYLGFNLAVFGFDYPPYFFVLGVKYLPHQLLILFEGEFRSSVKIGS